LDETTPAHAEAGGVFKRCCMRGGAFDGVERDDYFRE
jgi:hypothetical protein